MGTDQQPENPLIVFPPRFVNPGDERQSGRTTEQMQSAPLAAYYVIPSNACFGYMEDLACKLGREDLRLTPKERFTVDLIRCWLGRRYDFPGIVIDHATEMGPKQQRAIDYALERFETLTERNNYEKPASDPL